MSHEVKDLEIEILFDSWSKLKRVTYEYSNGDGKWEAQKREVYDRGNGAAILLYNKGQQTVILTKQFRLPLI